MHVIEKAVEGILSITLAGQTTVDDYEATVPALESEIEARDTVRIIWDVGELETAEPQAIWRDVVFDMGHRVQTGRVALVGSKAWEKWAKRMFPPAPNVKVEYFRPEERERAHRWVRGVGSD